MVLADHVGHLQGRIWLKQRRAGPLHTGQRPPAEVDPQLGHAALWVEVGGERHRQFDRAAVAGDVQHELLNAPRRRENGIDVLHADAALGHPAGRVGDEARNPEAPRMRPLTGWCTSGSPANDPMSASISPVIRPSKKGTAVSSSCRRSSMRARTGKENSSGMNGIRRLSGFLRLACSTHGRPTGHPRPRPPGDQGRPGRSRGGTLG